MTDIQKFFSLTYDDGKLRRNLESAVDYLNIEKPFGKFVNLSFDDEILVSVIASDFAEEIDFTKNAENV